MSTSIQIWSLDELKNLSLNELTALYVGNNGALNVLRLMSEHNVTPKEMIVQVEESNAAIRPLLKKIGVDLA